MPGCTAPGMRPSLGALVPSGRSRCRPGDGIGLVPEPLVV
jgi:hypothetical protein